MTSLRKLRREVRAMRAPRSEQSGALSQNVVWSTDENDATPFTRNTIAPTESAAAYAERVK